MTPAAKKIDLGRLESFLQGVDAAKNDGELHKVVRKQITRQGFEFFSYQLLLPPSGPRILLYLTGFQKEWSLRYFERKYIRDDLVSRHAAASVKPFLWNEITHERFYTPTQKIMFSEGAEFGLKAGGTIPIHGPGAAKALFSVANRVSKEEFAKAFLLERHELQIVATYMHDRLLQLGLQKPPSAPNMRLSPREAEVLTWIANGKKNDEISTILNISEPMVKEYTTNACHKLDTSTRTHAVAVAILHGLISP